MIAIDTNVLIAIVIKDERSKIVQHVKSILEKYPIYLPCAVVTEFFSVPEPLPNHMVDLVNELDVLPITEGLWRRARLLRTNILRLGLKCLLADALIAQQAIDAKLPLATLDADFRHFVPHGLQLVEG